MDRASVWLHGIEKVYHKDDFDVRVSANEFSLENDYRFQLICSSCNSPVTFVKHKDGRKYFRHPKRTSKELLEKDKSCAQRSDSVNPRQIKRFNTIIEQTTLGEITCNFYQMIGNLYNYNELTLQRVINDSKRKSVKKLLDMIESAGEREIKYTISKTEEKSINEAKQRLRLNKRERFERYTRIFNKVDSDAQDQEVLLRGDNFTLDYIFDNKNLLFHQIAEMFWNYEHNPELIDEKFRDIYPLLVNQQLDILPRLFGMIMHKTSWEMRYFLLFNELCYQYEFNRKNNLDNNYFEEINDREIDKLKHHLSNIIVLEAYADQINDKVVQKFIGIKTKQELVPILNQSVEVFNRQMSSISPIKITGAFVSDFLKKYPVDSFYNALNKAKKDFNEKIKGFGGWIYLATNKSLTKRGIDNEVKIGKTKNIPKRLAQYQFASADGFIYEKHWRVKDRHKAEKFIHRALNKHKIENESGGKEWFSLSVDVGIMRVNELIEEYEKRYGYFEKIPEKKKGFG